MMHLQRLIVCEPELEVQPRPQTRCKSSRYKRFIIPRPVTQNKQNNDNLGLSFIIKSGQPKKLNNSPQRVAQRAETKIEVKQKVETEEESRKRYKSARYNCGPQEALTVQVFNVSFNQ
ncbi:Hypothetical_protein [Hexamita inflata]|uniref:Hypothetical_protein n=1 Tax=Hexamita inflata TaxID=28002 RepID=A0ABP1HWG1_9EUKA